MSEQRLTIMYRPCLPKDRVRELISSDDASIVCWDDVFAERDALAQRCRGLEAANSRWLTENEDLLHSLMGSDMRADALRDEIDTLRAEVETLRELATAHADASHYASRAEELRKDAERYRGVRRGAAAHGYTEEQFDEQTDRQLARLNDAMRAEQ